MDFSFMMSSYDNVKIYLYVILFFASIFGGFVGSMSGGAGMITLPLLLLTGINPLQALATNKLQACIGSFTSAAHYAKSGFVDIAKSRVILALAFVFSAFGTISVQYIDIKILSKILPFVMIFIGIYFLFSPHISDKDRAKHQNSALFISLMALSSFYGGLLGVGVGSFILALLVSVGGYGLSSALGYSRWIVFFINIAAMVFFTMGGNVLWVLGLLMCVGQSIGASFGAKLAIKHGAKIIRPFVIILCFAMSIKLIIEEFFY